MHRNTPLLTFAALSTLTLAACQDNVPTELHPNAAPLAAKGGNGNDNGNGNDQTPTAGRTSAGNVAPMAYPGNTSGDGTDECRPYGGATAVKVDGADGRTIAGYTFRVDGGTTLSFSQASPGSAITAVIVKGGSAYDVYDYYRNGAGNTGTNLAVKNDEGLTSPYVGNGRNGGNIPDISHYVVCSVPVVQVTKTLVAVMTSDGHGGMTQDGSWSSGNPVVIPQGETRWLQFRIDYQQAPGASGTLTENGPAVCATLGSGFDCTSANFGSSPVSGTGSKTVTIDLKNNDCSSGTLTNTVTFASGGVSTSASAAVVIQGLCVQKRLVQVMTWNGSAMIPDPTYQDGKVTIPQGETRWLEYEIRYTLPAGVSATLGDNVDAACNTLYSAAGGPGKFTCSTSGFEGYGGQSLSVTGTDSRRIIIDIKNEKACGDRDFINTAVLSRAGAPSISATSKVMIWTPSCTQ